MRISCQTTKAGIDCSRKNRWTRRNSKSGTVPSNWSPRSLVIFSSRCGSAEAEERCGRRPQQHNAPRAAIRLLYAHHSGQSRGSHWSLVVRGERGSSWMSWLMRKSYLSLGLAAILTEDGLIGRLLLYISSWSASSRKFSNDYYYVYRLSLLIRGFYPQGPEFTSCQMAMAAYLKMQ